MSQSLLRTCLCCKQLFHPDHRNRRHQKYCSQPACRKASKAESQRRWLSKPANRDYFRGSANVQRVQAWRKKNLRYWKRSPKAEGTLQEVLISQTTDQEAVTPKGSTRTLQDLLNAQVPLLVGLISQLIDSPLQEHIEQTAQRLLAKGLDILGMPPGTEIKGPHENQKTGALSATSAPSTPTIQLDRPPFGS